MTRIVLIHATPVAMEPVSVAFHRSWPEAELANVLDDSLPGDLERAGTLTDEIAQRILMLSRYAETLGGDGVLFTCTAFGSAISSAARQSPLPVLRPNEAMFAEAVARGGRVGLLTTFPPSVDGMLREFHEAAEAGVAGPAGPAIPDVVCVPDALQALIKGDGATHDRLLAQAAGRLGDVASVVLAQFSMARARAMVAEAIGFEPLTAPDNAVRRMRQRVEGVRQHRPPSIEPNAEG